MRNLGVGEVNSITPVRSEEAGDEIFSFLWQVNFTPAGRMSSLGDPGMESHEDREEGKGKGERREGEGTERGDSADFAGGCSGAATTSVLL